MYFIGEQKTNYALLILFLPIFLSHFFIQTINNRDDLIYILYIKRERELQLYTISSSFKKNNKIEQILIYLYIKDV